MLWARKFHYEAIARPVKDERIMTQARNNLERITSSLSRRRLI
jgi:hypothetical protein